MRILVVDDTPETRTQLTAILGSQPDRQILAAKDGADAWWTISEPGEKIDLCICDIGMPGIDGLKLLARVRRDPRYAKMAFILCTATADRKMVAEAASLAPTAYMVKPVNAAALLQKISVIEAQLMTAA